MNSERVSRKIPSKIIWTSLVAVCLIILLVAIFPSAMVGRGGKANAIINNLRYIDAAKQQWAFDMVSPTQIGRLNLPDHFPGKI
jgi:hypothetical protein